MNLSWLIRALAGLLLPLALAPPSVAEPPKFNSIHASAPPFGQGPWRGGRGSARPFRPGGGVFGGFGNRPPEVAQYDKFELSIDLTATFDNPYDPADVDLWGEFTGPSGKTYKIWGFYYPTSVSAQWMLRFAPPDTGAWKYVLKVRDREGEASSDERELTVTPASSRGFVTIAPNKRYLQYSDGSSFYGVGLWFNDDYERFGGGAIKEESLDELARLGVNFISFYSTPLETRGTGLGRYDQNLAGRLDQVVQWCEERDIHISWNVVFHSYVAENVWGPGNSWYRNNPYRTIARAKDFFASDEAWEYQAKVNRYIIARWGYSRALFLWFVIDEINGTEAFQQGSMKSALAWCRKMNDFFHEHDPYGRPTTGTQSGGLENWWPEGYAIFDVAGREIYEAQGHPMPEGKPDPAKLDALRQSYLNYAKQCAALWNGFEKPALIAESGWDHTYYEPGTPGYLALYHNALWASLASGASSSPFWWAYNSFYLNDSLLTGQLRAFSSFVADIDFAGQEWKPLAAKITAGDAWAMASDALIFGWAANPAGGAARETITLEGLRDGEYDVLIFRTWRGFYLPPIAAKTEAGRLAFAIPELRPQDGRGQNIGDDVAFKIVKRGADAAKTAQAASR